MHFTYKAREMIETITSGKARSCITKYSSGEYEVGIWSLHGIQRWLYATLPNVAKKVQGRLSERTELGIVDFVIGR